MHSPFNFLIRKNSIKVTSDEPREADVIEPRKRSPKIFLGSQDLRVVNDSENPRPNIRRDHQVKGHGISDNRSHTAKAARPKDDDATRKTNCRDNRPVPRFGEPTTKPKRMIRISF